MPNTPKNANRRLDDRLWTASGDEYERQRGVAYYATVEEFDVIARRAGSIVAVQRDHSAVEWLGGREGKEALAAARSNGGVLHRGARDFRPTVWKRPGAADVILFEEDHS